MAGARKLLGGMVAVVAAGARHAAWYLRYQVDGSTRDDSPPDDSTK